MTVMMKQEPLYSNPLMQTGARAVRGGRPLHVLIGAGHWQTSQRSSSELSPQPSTPLHKIALDLHFPFRQVNESSGHSPIGLDSRRARRPEARRPAAAAARGLPLLSGVLEASAREASRRSMAALSVLTRGDSFGSPAWLFIAAFVSLVAFGALVVAAVGLLRVPVGGLSGDFRRERSHKVSVSSLPSRQSSTALQNT